MPDTKEFTPIGDLIAIERIENKQQIEKILPKQKSIGKVVNIGSGILKNNKKYTFGIKKGDYVIFETHRGYSEKINNKKILFVSFNHILAKIDKDLQKENIEININETNTFSI